LSLIKIGPSVWEQLFAGRTWTDKKLTAGIEFIFKTRINHSYSITRMVSVLYCYWLLLRGGIAQGVPSTATIF